MTRLIHLISSMICGLSLIIGLLSSHEAVADDLPVDSRTSWSSFRHDPAQTGVATSDLPDEIEKLWEVQLGDRVSGSAAISGDFVYVPCESGELFCLEKATGKRIWSYPSAEQAVLNKAAPAFKSSPTIAGNVIYLGDDAGQFHAIDRTTGKRNWTFATEGAISSSAAVANERIVFGSYDGFIYCLNLDGALAWKQGTGGGIHSSPAVIGNLAFVTGCDGTLYALAINSGEKELSLDLDTHLIASPLVRGDHVYLGTYSGDLLAVNWKSREIDWRHQTSDGAWAIHSSAALTRHTVIVGGRDGHVHSIFHENGQKAWTFATRGRIDSSPAVVGRRVFIGSSDGSIYGINVSDGKEAWHFQTGKPITASPAVGEGVLVIGNESSEGKVFCFGEVLAHSSANGDQVIAQAADLGRQNTAATDAKRPLVGSKPGAIETKEMVLKETTDGLSAYSKLLGAWSSVTVGLPKDESVRMSHAVVNRDATVLIDNQLLGYSSKSGRWDKLTIPAELVGKVMPHHDSDFVSIRLGDRIYVLSPESGQWQLAYGVISFTKPLGDTFDSKQIDFMPVDSANPKKLAEAIAEHDALAEQLASTLRRESKTPLDGATDSPSMREQRQKLEATLAKTFEMKQQLELARVKELQSRLSRLEQQIAERASQRVEIIERRKRELLERSETVWSPESAANDRSERRGDPTVAAAAPQGSGGETLAISTRVRLDYARSPGVRMAIIDSHGERHSLPYLCDFERSEKEFRHYPLKLVSDLPGDPVRELRLDVYPSAPASKEFLNNSYVDWPGIQFFIKPWELQGAGNEYDRGFATVNFLPREKGQEPIRSNITVMTSGKVEESIQIFARAEKEGTPLVALVFLPLVADDKRPAEKTDRDDSRYKNAEPAPSSVGSRASLDLGNQVTSKELATGFEAARFEIANAQQELDYNERLFQQKVISANEVEMVKRKLATATRKYQILRDEYAATVRDLELQLEAARAELKSATTFTEHADVLHKAARGTYQDVLEGQGRTEQATFAIKRLQARYDVFKKIGADFLEEPPTVPDSTEEQISSIHRLNIKASRLNNRELAALYKTRYRGGLRVTEVTEGGIAGKGGIQVGDILVGLDRWETTKHSNAEWILNEVDPEPGKKKELKFFIVRGDQTITGTMTLGRAAKSNAQ